MFPAMFYIHVRGATGDSFARVGPYQSEDEARKAARFSKIKHYQIEEASPPSDSTERAVRLAHR